MRRVLSFLKEEVSMNVVQKAKLENETEDGMSIMRAIANPGVRVVGFYESNKELP